MRVSKLILVFLLSLPLFGFNYADTAKGRAFINKMHRKYGFSKSYIREILSGLAKEPLLAKDWLFHEFRNY